MNKLNQKIILELMKNSRTPVTTLAKKLKASREVITYRINKLKKDKVILNFVTEINIAKLGYVGAAVFVNVKTKKEKEFKQFLEKADFVSWVAELSGVWSFGLSIYGRSNEEIDQKFLLIYNRFKEDIIDHRITMHRRSLFYYEKYLENKAITISKKRERDYSLDQKDKTILQELTKNSRVDCVKLSQKVKLTAPAVSKRIKELEKSNFIEKYSLFIDVSKLGLLQYSIFIINKNINDKEKLLAYLKEHPKVSFIAEYVGDPFLEFGIVVKDPYALRPKLQEIEESFPDNRIIEVSLFQKEIVSVGPPECVFNQFLYQNIYKL